VGTIWGGRSSSLLRRKGVIGNWNVFIISLLGSRALLDIDFLDTHLFVWVSTEMKETSSRRVYTEGAVAKQGTLLLQDREEWLKVPRIANKRDRHGQLITTNRPKEFFT
jgi:hypothetical protein